MRSADWKDSAKENPICVDGRSPHGESCRRPRILTFTDYYFPGFKGGGPLRTIANLVEQLDREFEFLIVTGDRDLGDGAPYARVPLDEWIRTPHGSVFYVPQQKNSLLQWRSRLESWKYDVVYLNSLFSRTTIRTLLLRRLGLVPARPAIIAPRGELFPEALVIRQLRKRLFLSLGRAGGLFRGITWQASTRVEADRIARVLGTRENVRVASDLASCRPVAPAAPPTKRPGELRAVFVSRISRIKNLDLALRLLSRLRGITHFEIFGPIEDKPYWLECEALRRSLPEEVQVSYRGELEGTAAVIGELARHHVLLLPTRSENFGHAILEALVAGCPPLISDQTPWRDLSGRHAGWDIPLDHTDRMVAALQQAMDMDHEEFVVWSKGARAVGLAAMADEGAIEANRELFRKVLMSSSGLPVSE